MPSGLSRNRATSGFALVGYIALVRVVLYFFAATHYGYVRDELYYLAGGVADPQALEVNTSFCF